MSTAVAPALMTAEEFLSLPENGMRRELVRGQVVEMPMPGFKHGKVNLNIARIVANFVVEHDLGHMADCDTFVITRRSPDSVRGTDILFISYARLPKEQTPEGALEIAPELVFETRSPSDRWIQLVAKAAEYIEAGVNVVCIADPKDRTITVYRANEKSIALTENDVFTLPDILPGFSLPVRKFFE